MIMILNKNARKYRKINYVSIDYYRMKLSNDIIEEINDYALANFEDKEALDEFNELFDFKLEDERQKKKHDLFRRALFLWNKIKRNDGEIENVESILHGFFLYRQNPLQITVKNMEDLIKCIMGKNDTIDWKSQKGFYCTWILYTCDVVDKMEVSGCYVAKVKNNNHSLFVTFNDANFDTDTSIIDMNDFNKNHIEVFKLLYKKCHKYLNDKHEHERQRAMKKFEEIKKKIFG